MQPFMPYFEYFVNKSYIAQFLCINKDKPEVECYGKCHLIKSIQNANKENHDPAQTPKPEAKFENDIKALSKRTDPGFFRNSNKKTLHSWYTFIFKEYQSDIPTPPPKPFC